MLNKVKSLNISIDNYNICITFDYILMLINNNIMEKQNAFKGLMIGCLITIIGIILVGVIIFAIF